MPRAHRVHAPGAAIHITARTQNKSKWFDEEMRDDIVAIIVEGMKAFGHVLLAQTVMPNHFHIIMQQGRSPLGHAMQRVMQRTSLRVKRRHDIDGHVFSRAYWSEACSNANHIRRAIVYTNLNGWAANLANQPEDYRWSSHHAYIHPHTINPDILRGLLLFATHRADVSSARRNYIYAVRETMRRRRNKIWGDIFLPGAATSRLSPWPQGDHHWATHFAPAPAIAPIKSTDIGDDVAGILRSMKAECGVDVLRFAGRCRAIAPLRANVVAALRSRGYRPSQIARYLMISEALVSKIAARIAAAVPGEE